MFWGKNPWFFQKYFVKENPIKTTYLTSILHGNNYDFVGSKRENKNYVISFIAHRMLDLFTHENDWHMLYQIRI